MYLDIGSSSYFISSTIDFSLKKLNKEKEINITTFSHFNVEDVEYKDFFIKKGNPSKPLYILCLHGAHIISSKVVESDGCQFKLKIGFDRAFGSHDINIIKSELRNIKLKELGI